MRILGTAHLTVAGGVLMALALFSMTMPPRGMCCPVDFVVTDYGDINPWTGEVRPLRVNVYARDGSGELTRTYVTFEMPENWKDLRVIPLPVGFAVGSLLTLTVITIAARRPRRPAPDSAVPAA
jgi:hypothetical protein